MTWKLTPLFTRLFKSLSGVSFQWARCPGVEGPGVWVLIWATSLCLALPGLEQSHVFSDLLTCSKIWAVMNKTLNNDVLLKERYFVY